MFEVVLAELIANNDQWLVFTGGGEIAEIFEQVGCKNLLVDEINALCIRCFKIKKLF